MANEKRARTPLTVKVNEAERTLILPRIANSNDLSYGKVHQDIERIQFYSIGNGGAETLGDLIEGMSGARENGELLFKFEQEEFNCVLRYLLKYEWKRAEGAIT
jgi:hypothetical protein